jgi:hypothetical protein
MSLLLFLSIFVLAGLTVLACYTKTSNRLILILVIQATVVTMASLVPVLLELASTGQSSTLVKLATVMGEWAFAALVTPLIIYYAVKKTVNVVDQPTIGVRNTSVLIIVMVAAQALLWLFAYPLMPEEFIIFIPVVLALSIDFVLMTTRDDPIKILVGLNIAETALFPFIEQTPLIFVPPLFLLISLVNVVGVFLIIHAYREYGVLSVSEWRKVMK